jgi:hypothetical protein
LSDISSLDNNLFYNFEQSLPPGASVPTEPDHPGLAHNTVFRNKSPEPAVLGTLAVVSHHPVIIHFEGIGGYFPAIKKKPAVFPGEIISFIKTYGSFIDREILGGKMECCSFFGDPYFAIIIL